MTYQEAKDQVAKENGWENAEEFEWNEDRVSVVHELTMDAAKLYAKAKWDEACEAQKAMCVNEFARSEIGTEGLSLRGCPKPEFKP